MPQMHFSVDERSAKLLAKRAKARGMSLSRYLAEIARSQLRDEWPRGYLDSVVGSCRKTPLEEPEDLALDDLELDNS